MTGTAKPSGSGRVPSYKIKPTDVPYIKKRIREGEFLKGRKYGGIPAAH